MRTSLMLHCVSIGLCAVTSLHPMIASPASAQWSGLELVADSWWAHPGDDSWLSNSTTAVFDGPGSFQGVVIAAPEAPSCECDAKEFLESTSLVETLSMNEWQLGISGYGAWNDCGRGTTTIRFHRASAGGIPAALELLVVDSQIPTFGGTAKVRLLDGSWEFDLVAQQSPAGTLITIPPGGDFQLTLSSNSCSRRHLRFRLLDLPAATYAAYAEASATSEMHCSGPKWHHDVDERDGELYECGYGFDSGKYGARCSWSGTPTATCLCAFTLNLSAGGEDTCWSCCNSARANFWGPSPLNLITMSGEVLCNGAILTPSMLPLSLPAGSSFSVSGGQYCSLGFSFVDANQDGLLDEIQSFADIDADGLLDRCEHARADFNLDDHVNSADLSTLFSSWGDSGIADINQDGAVDATDLKVLLSNWGNL
jgi:hypothetical protein